ncbi:MAG: competence/damage-inducible protein A [Thermodesulfobacteriota bacterium]
MIAETLSTGEEIRSGATVDTNSAYIAETLEQAGLAITRHTCVGDDLTALVSVLREIGGRARFAVVTGGLGPTADDLTASAAAQAAGVELQLYPAALAAVRSYFESRGRVMSRSNEKQAFFPAGAEPIMNPIGTAPGFTFQIDRCLFFFLPGVPAEMRRMLSEIVLPRLQSLQGESRRCIQSRTITTFGLTESATGERLAGYENRFPGVKLGFRVRFPEIHVKLYGRGCDEHDLAAALQAATDWITARLGEKVLCIDGGSMETVVGRLLKQKGATLAVAESCTGGLISHWLTNVPGSSDYFLFSGVTYANAAKTQVLGVSPQALQQHGAVSEETAKEMAAGVRRLAGATYGLAVSGVAGPDGGTPEKPVGTVCIGLATPHTLISRRYCFPFGDRLRNKEMFAACALNLLRRELMKSL